MKICSDICPWTLSVLRCEQFSKSVHCSSRKTVSFEEQIMSNEKFLGINLRQVEAIVSIIHQIFSQRASNLGNITQIFLSFSWGIFSHVMHLNQLHTRKNI